MCECGLGHGVLQDCLPVYERCRSYGKRGDYLAWVDSTVVCNSCRLKWYLGGVCLSHLRRFSRRKGWCYAMALQRLQKGSGGDDRKRDPSELFRDDKFFAAMPTLWEFLTLEGWEDGTVRETGTVFVFVEDDRWKCCLNDRDSGHVGFISADSWQGLWKACEKHLADQTVDWRLSRQARQKGQKRR